MRHRLAALGALLTLAFFATGCQITLSAGIDLRDDGSGTVHAAAGFDDEAVAEIGDLGAALRAGDLRQAGWTVEGPAKEDDGLTWLRASKGFDDPEEAAALAAQLSGPEGPFKDFQVTHDRSLLQTRTSFSGVVDLSGGLAGLSDADLQSALGDFDLGLDLEGLRSRFGDALGERVQVQVAASLPGKAEAAATGDGPPTVDGGRAVWTPALGQRVELVATGQLRRLAPLVYGAIALVLVTLGLVVVVMRTRTRRRQVRR